MSNLSAEADFANHAYEKHAHNLLMNVSFFQKYANPRHAWDWRQFGAHRLGGVAGCRLLDFGCGAGEEAVYFARLGALVTAIDISPVGIDLVKRRAAVNGVSVDARQMRCDPTLFPDASFEVVHGFGILHHIGLETGLREVKRLLVPGGRGLFFEHMGNSPLIQRLKFNDNYTNDERPVRWNELQEVRGFRVFETTPFHLVSRLRNRIAWTGRDGVKQFDAALLTLAPRLRHFASGVVIYLET